VLTSGETIKPKEAGTKNQTRTQKESKLNPHHATNKQEFGTHDQELD
jgi:hypothetical protein